jgi:hypothetical protein
MRNAFGGASALTRRAGLGLLGAALVGGALLGAPSLGPVSPAMAGEHRSMTVYRSPSCGCCGAWIDYVESHGYAVVVRDMEDITPVKRAAGVPEPLYACHTAMIDGYTVEGHVPVEAIDRLLEERPAVQGIGVAGMPLGSPGMGEEVPVPYTAYTFRGGRVGEAFMTFPATE